MNITKPFGIALVALTLWSASAHAQTPMPMPNGGIPTPPVPQQAVDQAQKQATGQFTKMKRSIAGGQIQEAWDDADDNAGVTRLRYCRTCSYKVRLRQHMVSVLDLPIGEVIKKIDVGDIDEFTVEQREPNRISIKPAGYGVDSNVIIHGQSGNVYPIYLRSENFYSVNVPDLFIEIVGKIKPINIKVAAIHSIDGHLPNEAAQSQEPAEIPPLVVENKIDAVAGLEIPDPERVSGDFVQAAPFDPDTLRGWGEYEIWGDGPNVNELKPLTIFRDDYFTYIRYGDKWKDIELPTAYVVIDGIDELVNTRVQGRTYIIESTQRLITLKSGLTYICINYVGAP